MSQQGSVKDEPIEGPLSAQPTTAAQEDVPAAQESTLEQCQLSGDEAAKTADVDAVSMSEADRKSSMPFTAGLEPERAGSGRDRGYSSPEDGLQQRELASFESLQKIASATENAVDAGGAAARTPNLELQPPPPVQEVQDTIEPSGGETGEDTKQAAEHGDEEPPQPKGLLPWERVALQLGWATLFILRAAMDVLHKPWNFAISSCSICGPGLPSVLGTRIPAQYEWHTATVAQKQDTPVGCCPMTGLQADTVSTAKAAVLSEHCSWG